MITLDTSAVIALVNADDPDHELVSAVPLSEPVPWIIPAGMAAEVGYMLESLGLHILDAFLEDLESGAYALDSALGVDIPRIRELVRRYHDLSLGFSDAAVISCAERNGGRVLSIDDRDFQVVARGERSITVIPGAAWHPAHAL